MIENVNAEKIKRRIRKVGKWDRSVVIPPRWLRNQMSRYGKNIEYVYQDFSPNIFVIRVLDTSLTDVFADTVFTLKRKIRRMGKYDRIITIPNLWLENQKQKHGAEIKELYVEEKESYLIYRPAKPSSGRLAKENPAVFSDPKSKKYRSSDRYFST